MPLSLPEESGFASFESGLRDSLTNKIEQWKTITLNLIYSLRRFKILKITIIHWSILSTWIVLLLHFTSVYGSLYQSSALLATMCTNVLLFGTSDCLAQCISCFLSYKVDPVPEVVDKVTRNLVAGLSFRRTESFDDNYSDNVSIFNDYGVERPSSRVKRILAMLVLALIQSFVMTGILTQTWITMLMVHRRLTMSFSAFTDGSVLCSGAGSYHSFKYRGTNS